MGVAVPHEELPERIGAVGYENRLTVEHDPRCEGSVTRPVIEGLAVRGASSQTLYKNRHVAKPAVAGGHLPLRPTAAIKVQAGRWEPTTCWQAVRFRTRRRAPQPSTFPPSFGFIYRRAVNPSYGVHGSLRIRYESREDRHEAFITLGRVMICAHALHTESCQSFYTVQTHRMSVLQPVWTVLSAILAVYGLYLALWLILPAISAFDHAAAAITAWLVYILVVAGVVVLTYPVIAQFYPQSTAHEDLYNQHLRLSLAIAVVLSIVGFVVVMYNYVAILQVDYSQGPAKVRSSLQAMKEAREGISILGIIGNFLGRFYIIALGILLVCWENIRPRLRYAYLASCLIAAFVFSFAIGGRLSILLVVCIAISSAIMRKTRGRSLLPGFMFTAGLAVLLALAFLYSAYVFSARAERSSLDAETYASSIVDHLGGEVNDSFHSIQTVENGTYRDFLYFSILNLAYVVHQIWSYEEILSSPERPSTIIWWHALLYMNRLGLIADPPGPHLVIGRFVPLSGAIWYDFGGFGLITVGILHGIALSIAVLLSTRGRLGVLGFGIALVIFALTVLSPMASVTMMTIDFTYLGASVLVLFLLIGWIRMGRILTTTSNRRQESAS